MKITPVQIAVLSSAALAIGLVGVGIGYGLRPREDSSSPAAAQVTRFAAAPRKPLYYKDPDDKPDYAATPKTTVDGRAYVAVFDEATPAVNVAPAAKVPARLLYYRNPMGLPDTSPVPKKDSMGMDYIPVYEGDDAPGTVSVSAARVQMLGVRTASAAWRTSLTRAIRATGAVQADESKLAIVTTKFDGFVEKLFVATTGASVRKGQALAQVWIQTPDVATQMGPDVITRQIDYIVALQENNAVAIAQAVRNLRNYGIPDSAISEIRRTGRATRSVVLTAPASGTVLEKTAVTGLHFNAGDPLFKTADLSAVWLMADVAEQDLGQLRPGEPARVSFVAYPGRTFVGKVDFVYPVLMAATRTGRARIVLTNGDGALRESMYASVVIDTSDAAAGRVLVVPDSAVIDSGVRQVVLIAKRQGLFQPRVVRIGARGDGYAQVLSGLKAGEQVVISANFLIDAESNLRAALQSFSPPAATASSTP